MFLQSAARIKNSFIDQIHLILLLFKEYYQISEYNQKFSWIRKKHKLYFYFSGIVLVSFIFHKQKC